MAYAPTAWQRFHVARTAADWTVERADVMPEIRTEVRQGEVRTSLWDAVDAGTISAQALLDLVQIFESSFDFAGDTRAGDRFRLRVEARYTIGTLVEEARILATQYLSEDQRPSPVFLSRVMAARPTATPPAGR